jgi:hypothetical protein
MGEVAGQQKDVGTDQPAVLVMEAPDIGQQEHGRRLDRVIHRRRSHPATRMAIAESKIRQMEQGDGANHLRRRQRPLLADSRT